LETKEFLVSVWQGIKSSTIISFLRPLI